MNPRRNQPECGTLRVVTNNGSGDRIVPVDSPNLTQEILDAATQGDGVVELSTPVIDASRYDRTGEEPQLKSSGCEQDPSCPLTVNRITGKLVAHAKGFKLPERCIQCAGGKMIAAAGFVTKTVSTQVSTLEELRS